MDVNKIISQAHEWSLEGDSFLLQWMEQISQGLEQRVTATSDSFQRLSDNVQRTSLDLDNTANIAALQFKQFIEIRCADDDEILTHSDSIRCAGDNAFSAHSVSNIGPTSKAVLKEFVSNNLEMLRNSHSKYPLEAEGQEPSNYIYQLKNIYDERPLPHIYGSNLWLKHCHVGLRDAAEDKFVADGISQSSTTDLDNISLDSNVIMSPESNEKYEPKIEVQNAYSSNEPQSDRIIPSVTPTAVPAYMPQGKKNYEHDLFASLRDSPPPISASLSGSSSLSSKHSRSEIQNRDIVVNSKPARLSPRFPTVRKNPVNLFDDEDYDGDDSESFLSKVEDTTTKNSQGSKETKKTEAINNTSAKPQPATPVLQYPIDLFDDDSFNSFLHHTQEKTTVKAPQDPTESSEVLSAKFVQSVKSHSPTPPLRRKPVNLFDDDDFNSYIKEIAEKEQPRSNAKEFLSNASQIENVSIHGNMKNVINLFDPEPKSQAAKENHLDSFKSPEFDGKSADANIPKPAVRKQVVLGESNKLRLTSLFDDEDNDDFFDIFSAPKPKKPISILSVEDEENANKNQEKRIEEKSPTTKKDDLSEKRVAEAKDYPKPMIRSIFLSSDEEAEISSIKKPEEDEETIIKSGNQLVSSIKRNEIASVQPQLLAKPNLKSKSVFLEKDEEVREITSTVKSLEEQINLINPFEVHVNKDDPTRTEKKEETGLFDKKNNKEAAEARSDLKSEPKLFDNNQKNQPVKTFSYFSSDGEPKISPALPLEKEKYNETKSENTSLPKPKEGSFFFDAVAEGETIKTNGENSKTLKAPQIYLNVENLTTPDANEQSEELTKNVEQNISEYFHKSQIIEKEEFPTDMNFMSSTNYANIFSDEPPDDDDDFFHSLSNNSKLKLDHEQEEEKKETEDDIFEVPIQSAGNQHKNNSGYSGILLISEVPPDDNNDADESDIFNNVASKTKRLHTIFYNDFNETLDAVSKSKAQAIRTETPALQKADEPDHRTLTIEEILNLGLGSKNDEKEKNCLEQSRRVEPVTQSEALANDDLKTSSIKEINPPKALSKIQKPPLQINVQALLPSSKFANRDLTKISHLSKTSLSSQVEIGDTEENVVQSVLTNVCKTRVRAPANRKPSTRRGRNEHYLKSLRETQYEINSTKEPNEEEHLTKSIMIKNFETQTSVSGTAYSNTTAAIESSTKYESFSTQLPAVDSYGSESQSISKTEFKKCIIEKQDSGEPKKTKEESSIAPELKVPKVVEVRASRATREVNPFSKPPSLFDSEKSDSDDDLFKSAKSYNSEIASQLKSSSNHTSESLISSIGAVLEKSKLPSKLLTKKTNNKTSIFDDIDDSDDDNDLFGGKPSKAAGLGVRTAAKVNTSKRAKAKTSMTQDNPLADLFNS